jgi:hypothetical protein
MQDIAIIFVVVVFISLGLKFCKRNFDKEVKKISGFKLRYTFLLLLVAGGSAYVDALPSPEREIIVKQVTSYLDAGYSNAERVAKESYLWCVSELQKNN